MATFDLCLIGRRRLASPRQVAGIQHGRFCAPLPVVSALEVPGRIPWREEVEEMSKIPMIRDDLREGSGGTRLIGSVLLVELC